MKISRRQVLKTVSFSALFVGLAPRIVFSAPNNLRAIRTGLQPGGKTRLVIETATRPSYTLSYGDKQLIVNLSNTNGKQDAKTVLANGTLIKRITQIQDGSVLKVVAALGGVIDAIDKKQIMLLEPNGDNDYRLVIDFVAGTGYGITTEKTAAAKSAVKQPGTETKANTKTSANKRIIVIDPGHGGKDPGCIGKAGTKEKTVVLSVAKKLKSSLDAAGYRTFLTLSSDVFLKLSRLCSTLYPSKVSSFRVGS